MICEQGTGMKYQNLSPATCRILRANWRMSRTELAIRAEVTTEHLRLFETGAYTFGFYARQRIARVFADLDAATEMKVSSSIPSLAKVRS